MAADHNPFQDLIEFEMGKHSKSSKAESAIPEPAQNESAVSLKAHEQRLFAAFKNELIFIDVVQKTRDIWLKNSAFRILLGLLQVPDLRARVGKCLGRPGSLIYEGEVLAMLRQNLKETVTSKPPSSQSQDHWYAHQLGTQKFIGFEEWLTPAIDIWTRQNDFDGFFEKFCSLAEQINRSFADWLSRNRQPINYRDYRTAASRLRKLLEDSVKGQSSAIDGVCDGYAQSILRKSSGPRGIFTLLGAPGTGKTMLAETFAKLLPEVDGEQYQILKFNMEQFNDGRANAALFGAGHFYADAALGQLTDPVRSVPKSIIIFDEVEKAHPEVIQSLLGILDRGVGKDATTLRETDFSQAFIFFTTNLGQKVLKQRAESGQQLGVLDAQNVAGILQRTAENERGLSPEFLSRLGKGKFLTFEELPATSLIEIYANAWNAAVTDAQIHTPVPSCSTELATLQLLGHLPALSARAAATAPEQDVVEYLDRALEEFEASLIQTADNQLTDSTIEGVQGVLERLYDEHDLQSSIHILLIDDDARTQEILAGHLKGVEITCVATAEQAAEVVLQQKPDLLLIDLLISSSNQEGQHSAALQHIIRLRTQLPSVPVLAFGLDTKGSAENHRLFRLARDFEGVAGVLAYRSGRADGFLAWVQSHVERLRCASLVQEFQRCQKRLRFSWQAQENNGELIMSPGLVRAEKAVSPEDIGGIAGLGGIPDERLADVVGNERAVDTIFQAVSWLSKPKDIGKFGITPPRGYLLEGPPGTGKTFLAKAVAGECGLPFFSINGASFVQKYYGESGRMVRELFAKARQYAPSIIFIDEIDAFAMSRDSNERSDVSGINALLSEMDGFDSRKHPVLVLAATNYRSRLDAALLRAGRFDEVIVCDLPNKAARLEMIRRGYKKVGLDDSEEAIESLAMRTQGSSAADIDALIREAIYHAVSEGRDPTAQDIEEACARVVYGSVRTDLSLAKEEKWSTACHEAGHAIATHVLLPNRKLDYLSIQPRSNSLGFVSYRQDSDNAEGALSLTVSELKAQLIVLLAGREAERLMLGAEHMCTGATSDLQRANQLAFHAIAECGLDAELGPVAVSGNSTMSGYFSKLVAERLRVWLGEAESECAELLATHQGYLKTIAQLLYEHESLDGQQFLQALAR